MTIINGPYRATDLKILNGEIVDLSQSEMTIEEFVTLIDAMRAEQPTGRLLIIPKWVGKWLYENHEAFKPITVEEI